MDKCLQINMIQMKMKEGMLQKKENKGNTKLRMKMVIRHLQLSSLP